MAKSSHNSDKDKREAYEAKLEQACSKHYNSLVEGAPITHMKYKEAASTVTDPDTLKQMLLDCVRVGFYDVVQTILEKEKDDETFANTTDNRNNTPLHLVSSALCNLSDKVAMVDLLTEHDADYNALNNIDDTPLLSAIHVYKPDFALILLKKNKTYKKLGEALHSAAEKGQYAVVEELLDQGVSANVPKRFNDTPMHTLASVSEFTEDHEQVMRLLASRGANVNAENSAGDSPILVAVDTSDTREIIEGKPCHCRSGVVLRELGASMPSQEKLESMRDSAEVNQLRKLEELSKVQALTIPSSTVLSASVSPQGKLIGQGSRDVC